MVKHILLNNIYIYEQSHDRGSATEDSIYLPLKGYWYDSAFRRPLVSNAKKPMPTTKKHDVERGEDRK